MHPCNSPGFHDNFIDLLVREKLACGVVGFEPLGDLACGWVQRATILLKGFQDGVKQLLVMLCMRRLL